MTDVEYAGDGDTSVCISAKLPFEAGGEGDAGKKRVARMGKEEA